VAGGLLGVCGMALSTQVDRQWVWMVDVVLSLLWIVVTCMSSFSQWTLLLWPFAVSDSDGYGVGVYLVLSLKWIDVFLHALHLCILFVCLCVCLCVCDCFMSLLLPQISFS
jgi:hypothetical protein